MDHSSKLHKVFLLRAAAINRTINLQLFWLIINFSCKRTKWSQFPFLNFEICSISLSCMRVNQNLFRLRTVGRTKEEICHLGDLLKLSSKEKWKHQSFPQMPKTTFAYIVMIKGLSKIGSSMTLLQSHKFHKLRRLAWMDELTKRSLLNHGGLLFLWTLPYFPKLLLK